MRLVRDSVVVHKNRFAAALKDDVSEVKSGMECGITVEKHGDVSGRHHRAFVTERVAAGFAEPGIGTVMAVIGVLT
jgi:hypothetical protein